MKPSSGTPTRATCSAATSASCRTSPSSSPPDVNGPDRGWETYAADLQEVIDALPDIHWELQQFIVDGSWLAARLVTTGTHHGVFRELEPTGRQVSAQELVVYRWDGTRFLECWGDLAAVLRDALVPAHPWIPPRSAAR